MIEIRRYVGEKVKAPGILNIWCVFMIFVISGAKFKILMRFREFKWFPLLEFSIVSARLWIWDVFLISCIDNSSNSY